MILYLKTKINNFSIAKNLKKHGDYIGKKWGGAQIPGIRYLILQDK